MYSSLTHQQSGFPWRVSPGANPLLLKGTGLTPGQEYGCALVGYEWDSIFANGASPVGLQVIGASNAIDDNNISDTSNTTYYIAPSGSLVFATGSMYWTAALDSYRFTQDPLCIGKPLVVPGMQQLLANVMKALVIVHNSHQLTF
jgi:hypothetical protein